MQVRRTHHSSLWAIAATAHEAVPPHGHQALLPSAQVVKRPGSVHEPRAWPCGWRRGKSHPGCGIVRVLALVLARAPRSCHAGLHAAFQATSCAPAGAAAAAEPPHPPALTSEATLVLCEFGALLSAAGYSDHRGHGSVTKYKSYMKLLFKSGVFTARRDFFSYGALRAPALLQRTDPVSLRACALRSARKGVGRVRAGGVLQGRGNDDECA